MKKNKFIESTIILLIGGFITKILGMFIKIITTRIIGSKAIGIYMLLMPTFNLFITLAQAGFPIAISKIVSEDKNNNKKVIFTSIFISFMITMFLIILLIVIDPYLCKFLHNKDLYYPIIAIGLTLPFISLSSIIRGYFFGKENMIPHVTSNAVEQIIRILLSIIILPKLIKYGVQVTITILILFNIISELTSIIVLYFFLPKKVYITKDVIKPDFNVAKDVLNISLPTTASRLIGTIGYFFEPILLTTFLIANGYKNTYITYEYGIITGYVMPLLMLPSFFSMAISQSILPVISNAYVNNKNEYIKNKIKQAILFSLSIGTIFTIFIMIYPEFFMKLVYNTTEGTNYIRIIAPFFLFYYIQVPLTSVLQAVNKAKEAMMSTLIGIIIKLLLIVSLSYLKIGLYPLIIAIIINIIYVTIFNYIKVKKIFN